MKSLSYLNKYFLKYKWLFLLGIVFTVVSNYFGVKMPELVGDTINNLLAEIDKIGTEGLIITALKIGGVYMLLSLGKGFFLFLVRQTLIIMSRHIEFDL
jgi:ATP-binding cassette subfamily B protein